MNFMLKIFCFIHFKLYIEKYKFNGALKKIPSGIQSTNIFTFGNFIIFDSKLFKFHAKSFEVKKNATTIMKKVWLSIKSAK